MSNKQNDILLEDFQQEANERDVPIEIMEEIITKFELPVNWKEVENWFNETNQMEQEKFIASRGQY